MMRTSYPGKLFLMGEYAVMNSGHKSVVTAVKRYLHVDLEHADTWCVTSRFGSIKGEAVFSMKTMPEVSASLRVVQAYLGKTLDPLYLEITSELDEGNQKYGFGSSGVVIVGVVDAILKHEKIILEKLELFKLCILVQKDLNSFSSGGDIAASIYGSVIVYERYDVAWLKAQTISIDALLKTEWPSLVITRLALYTICDLVIGWTQSSNKTENYTQAVKKQADQDPMTYHAFLLSSQLFVDDFIIGVTEKDYDLIKHALAEYRMLMLELEKWAQIDIETQALHDLIEASLNLGYGSKVSGSGGGDCGFALVPKGTSQALLKKAWLEKDILCVEEWGIS